MRIPNTRSVFHPVWLLLALLAAGPLAAGSPESRPVYPETRKTDQVDDYHGTAVPDPYRWLEDDTAAEVAGWVAAQNKVTFGYLDQIPYRDKIRARMEELFNYPRYSKPFRVGKYYFFTKNDGLQNQAVIYRQKGLSGTPAVFIDPNTLSQDGTVPASLSSPSRDDRYIAYTVSEAGSDWREIRVMEVATRRELPDRIRWVKFSGVAWYGDGFYYTGYDKPQAGQELSARNEFQKVFFHRLGTPQEQDTLFYEDKANPLRYYGASITEDGRYLLLTVSKGTHANEVYWTDLKRKSMPLQPLFRGFAHNYSVIDTWRDQLIVHTDDGAPNYRVLLVDPRQPAPGQWRELIPERPELLQAAATGGGKLFVRYLKDVTSRIYQFGLGGKLEKEIALPALGTAGLPSGEKEDRVLFYTFTSFTYPPCIFKYDVKTGRSELFRQTELRFRMDDYETHQVFYPSKDGTRIPMFIVKRKGLPQNSQNPTYLYAYGGFNATMSPSFSPGRIVLLENGGIFALANLRGGGEYGEAWHQAGMREKKQNVFDDFIAAAEYLIAEKYTCREKLAIAGGSNGGLLVGACLAQRPELFGVAFPAVGVMDMLRFHKFTVGLGWAGEYGSSDQPEDFKFLYRYSPLHNLRAGTCYPATLVTTADHDDRVVPAHSFKFTAALQAAQPCDRPVLIRVETRAGHGGGKPLAKQLAEAADEWAFMFYNMGVPVRY